MEGGLLINIGKTAIMTIVISRVSKAIGEKEIGEIVSAVGLIACSVYIITAFVPLANGIQQFGTNFAEGMKGANEFLQKLMFWK